MTDAVMTLPLYMRAPIRDLVLSDTPEGFVAYYAAEANQSMPHHVIEAVYDLYDTRDKALPLGARWVWEAFRGGLKSSTFTERFMAYQIGLHPERSNIIVMASDASAHGRASNVADIIEKSPVFHYFFPNVVPDKEKGWGAEGYWVLDTSREEDWVRIRDHFPTLLADSHKASIVVGKHPTGVMVIDDINDEKNSASKTMAEEVNIIVTDTLFPMMERSAWNIFCQTPWNNHDALALVKRTGVWRVHRTPVLVPDEDGVLVEVLSDDGSVLYSVHADLAWPEFFTPELIAIKYREQATGGFIGFMRMYLLNVDTTEGVTLKDEWLRKYPHEDLDSSWVRVMGVDYASVMDQNKATETDYLAIAIGCIIPGGHVVLEDGKLAHVSQAGAKMLVRSYAERFNVALIVVEGWGSGFEFYQLLLDETDLPVRERKGPRGKGYRYEKIMAPKFELGRAWVSDKPNDFIDTFRQQWVQWPFTEHDDALDGGYYMIEAAVLCADDSGEAESTDTRLRREADTPSPWNFSIRRGR